MAKTQAISIWFVLWWTLATLVGMGVAFVVLLPLLLAVDFVGRGSLPLYIGLAAIFALAGSLIGLAQWLVLRNNSEIKARWIVATAGGFAAAAIVVLSLDLAPAAINQEWLGALLIPLVISTPQAWVLRDKISKPWLWVAASFVAFGVFFGLFVYADRTALVSLGVYLSYPLISGLSMYVLLTNHAVVRFAATKPKRRVTRKR